MYPKEIENIHTHSVPYHLPVMLAETIDILNIQPEGLYIDCTFGGGGHSREILNKLGPKGRLLAFDQDVDACTNIIPDKKLEFVNENFRHVSKYMRLYNLPKADGLLADLGVSSHQFDEATRGFSYRKNANLDMRMDQRQEKSAAEILQTIDVTALQTILSQYGEVTNAKTLAIALVEHRKISPFKTIDDLLGVLRNFSKGNPNKYFSQVFQALRIFVNEELKALEELLHQLPQIMNPGGIVAFITFHSLEDRIVKQYLKQGITIEDDPIYGIKNKSPFLPINKKPIEPSETEIKNNPRSRSAKLRAAIFN